MYSNSNSTPSYLKIAHFACVVSIVSITGCQSLAPIVDEVAIKPQPKPTLAHPNNFQKHHFSLEPNQTVVGTIASLKAYKKDTLPDIARHFGLGYNDIVISNPELDPWILEENTQVLLPMRFILPNTSPTGIVLNLANMRLFYFPKNQPTQVITYPIGIGKQGWNTPKTLTRIASKRKNPTWTPTPSIRREHAKQGDILPRVVKAGKNNPLGQYAMRLSLAKYLIHGTNKPYGVGMQVSHGCVRLYPEDIESLFNVTPVGTQVRIVEQPYLLGWDKSMLFLEAHKPIQKTKNFKKSLTKRLKRLIIKDKLKVDWKKVEKIIQQSNGVPTPILINSTQFEQLKTSAISISHPETLYGQPQTKPLTDSDWTIMVASLDDEKAARKLSALLNHQGPPISTQVIEKFGRLYVTSGPFANKKEVTVALSRIWRDFQINGSSQPPKSHPNSKGAVFSNKKIPPVVGPPPKLESPPRLDQPPKVYEPAKISPYSDAIVPQPQQDKWFFDDWI